VANPKKIKNKILASGIDKDAIKKLIAQYWYDDSKNIELKKVNDNLYNIVKNGKDMIGYKVSRMKDRYHFEKVNTVINPAPESKYPRDPEKYLAFSFTEKLNEFLKLVAPVENNHLDAEFGFIRSAIKSQNFYDLNASFVAAYVTVIVHHIEDAISEGKKTGISESDLKAIYKKEVDIHQASIYLIKDGKK